MILRILIACEFSGVFREAFRELGHNAWSCDIDPAIPPSDYHFQCDVRDVLWYDWDLLIAHPPYTYLTNAANGWLVQDGVINPERYALMKKGAEFFNLFLRQYHIPHIAVENPVMSRKHTGIRAPDFTCQPWQFGDNYKKRTCWWTKNLPRLQPTSDLDGSTAEPKIHMMSPSETRAKDRSVSPPGMAKAAAEQWSNYIINYRKQTIGS